MILDLTVPFRVIDRQCYGGIRLVYLATEFDFFDSTVNSLATIAFWLGKDNFKPERATTEYKVTFNPTNRYVRVHVDDPYYVGDTESERVAHCANRLYELKIVQELKQRLTGDDLHPLLRKPLRSEVLLRELNIEERVICGLGRLYQTALATGYTNSAQ